MAMESLGGSMPAGQPVAVSSGNRTHVFAIAAGGSMNHWVSTDADPWMGPTPLPGGNIVPSFPCAIALLDGSVHVFAIGNGGPLTHWSSNDGNIWAQQVDMRIPIPGSGNGLAVASFDGMRIDVFAVVQTGIIQYTFTAGQPLAIITTLPGSANLNRCVLAAVSAMPGMLDVFAVDATLGQTLHWHFDGVSWVKQMIAGPSIHINMNNGFAAVSPAPGSIELFAITGDARMTNWSSTGTTFLFKQLAAGSWPLPDGVPAVVAGSNGKLDVFAIGPGNVFTGGPLVHWRFDGTWSEPVAHEANLAAGGVTAVRGAAGLEAFGFNAGTNNSLLHWPAGIGATEHNPWQNWADNRQTNVEGHCYPTCLEELVAIVRTATQQDKRVRAVGSSWSFSDIAVTPGFVVETNRMTKLITTVLPKALLAPSATIPESKYLIHVEAGIQLEDLMSHLDTILMAPFTMGGASGQTLAGVISTSVHGSHFRLAPFPDSVRAIHLVGPDGKQYWIEPEDKPITDPNDLTSLQAALGSDVIIKHKDDWFDAALVTVGSLGIVYSVVFEVTDRYKLSETRTERHWLELKTELDGSSLNNVFTNDVDCVAVAIDPGSMGSDDPLCILAKRAAVLFSTPSSGKTTFDALGAFCESDLLLELLFEAAKAVGRSPIVIPALMLALPAVPAVLALTTLFPPALIALTALSTAAVTVTTIAAATSILIPLLKAAGPGSIGDVVGVVLDQQPVLVGALSSLVTKQFQGPTDPLMPIIDIAHNVMGPRNKGECATRGLGLEIAFDADGSQHIIFIDAALAMLKDETAMGHVLGGWFSIRFVGKSRAILSPQQSARTCMIEIVGLRTLSSTRILFDKLEMLGRQHGGIQHWGMFDNDLGLLIASDLKRAYPRLNTWRQIRWELTNGGTLHTFDSTFTIRSGLSDPPGTILIQAINFNPPGLDIDGEYVLIKNDIPVTISLTDWTLLDAANHRFTFPSFALKAGASVKVWTKSGANDVDNLFWRRRAAVWNNTGDTAILRDQSGAEVARFAY